MEADPLKQPGDFPGKNSVERLYSTSGVLHAPSSYILRNEYCRATGVLEKAWSLAPLETSRKL